MPNFTEHVEFDSHQDFFLNYDLKLYKPCPHSIEVQTRNFSKKLSPVPYIEYFSAGKGPICVQKKFYLGDLNQSDSVRAISTKKK